MCNLALTQADAPLSLQHELNSSVTRPREKAMRSQFKPVFPDLRRASVLITEGGLGIGASLTESFLDQGAKVTVVQRSNATEFSELMTRRADNKPHFIRCDLTDLDAIDAAVTAATTANGPLSVLINHASDYIRFEKDKITNSELDNLMAHTLQAYCISVHAATSSLKSASHASIINLSVTISQQDAPKEYILRAKGAEIHSLSKTQAMEFAPEKIRVNTLNITMTRDNYKFEPKEKEDAPPKSSQSIHPMEIYGVENSALFLASNASWPINGQEIKLYM